MGQTESRKLKRSKKSLVFPKASPEFMETFPKTNSPAENKDKEGSVGRKHAQTKGVAMSFGFRKKPASVPTAVRREFASAKKAEEQLHLPRRTVIRKESPVENQAFFARQEETLKPDANRFGFRVKRPQNTPRPASGAAAPQVANAYRSHINIQPQVGRYTLQSTELPQLEPVRVIESKTEKTIINTRRKSANNRQQYCETTFDDGLVTKCSIKNNNEAVYAESNSLTANKSYISYHKDEAYNNNMSGDATCNSFDSHSYEIKPVAKRSAGKNEDSFSTSVSQCNQEKARTTIGIDIHPEPDIQKTFFKLKLDEISKQDSQSDLWDNAGEAMALDLNQLNSYRSHKKSKYSGASLQASPQPARLISPLLVPPTLDAPDCNLANDDLSFVTAASTSVTGMLLDDEILSPIESLSTSESTDANARSSLSKDINEKSPNSTPPSPTNVSSMSLAEEKDFLIDDEIEDQPALTFKNGPGNDQDTPSLDAFKYEYDKDSLRRHLLKSHKKTKAPESSPSSLKTRRLFAKSTGSVDSLSSCESIGSDDFIMDYDSSHTNDAIDFHRSVLKSDEKTTRAQDSNARDSPWLEREIDYPLFSNNYPESRYAQDTDTLNYNFNNGFTLNLNVKQSPTIQKDVRDIKKLLVKLKMLLNDSDTQNPFRDILFNQEGYLSGQSDDLNDNLDNTNVVEKELADLRRQVLFLQVQLENKEEILASLQKQMADLSMQNHKSGHGDRGGESHPTMRTHCNAATQTKRIIA
ncbi:hypothetical protein GWI33_018322 [Rhynchophorus ferrugineus]|uniref:Uncharacterized protein n=1 Tax=Rhynchophorus ferrugineus TaxID=354439 RepID=A0A834HV48_RHYFE|nr:hypothetical protein GWI33_018322 [Rhynchophorus ferrugineus]